eukprot:s822_g33.t1
MRKRTRLSIIEGPGREATGELAGTAIAEKILQGRCVNLAETRDLLAQDGAVLLTVALLELDVGGLPGPLLDPLVVAIHVPGAAKNGELLAASQQR